METIRFRRYFNCITRLIQGSKRLFRPYRTVLLLIWDIFIFAVVGLNSFILLIYRNQEHFELKYVICAGAAAYFFVLLIQTCCLLNHEKRHKTLVTTKKVFRLIYTAIYLTSILLDVISLAEKAGSELILAYDGILFIWVSLWGTNCLWINQVLGWLGKKLPGGCRKT